MPRSDVGTLMVSPVGGPAHVWSQGGKVLTGDLELAAEGTLELDLQPHVDAVGVVGVAALQGLQILGQIWKEQQHPITISSLHKKQAQA